VSTALFPATGSVGAIVALTLSGTPVSCFVDVDAAGVHGHADSGDDRGECKSDVHHDRPPHRVAHTGGAPVTLVGGALATPASPIAPHTTLTMTDA
jgi:hypothetical protein